MSGGKIGCCLWYRKTERYKGVPMCYGVLSCRFFFIDKSTLQAYTYLIGVAQVTDSLTDFALNDAHSRCRLSQE